jgi:hypothetical protein
MNPPVPDVSPTSNHRPNRPVWPKFAFIAASLVTLAALLLSVHNHGTAATRTTGGPSETAKAERAAVARFIPPPIPDESNFVVTPFFAPLFTKLHRTESDRWPDDFSRADSLPREFPVQAESPIGRATGRFVTDFVAWQKAFEHSQPGADTNEPIVASESPEPVANARAALVVLNYLKPYEPVLAELREASKRPLARYNVDYDVENPWAILLPHLAVVKRTCQLLRLKAEAEVAAGHPQEALNDIVLMLRLVDSPKDEPVIISQLVRVACLQIGMQPIWEGLAGRTWSEPQLAALQSHLQQFDFVANLKHCLESEKGWANVTIGFVRDKRTPNLLLSMLDSGSRPQSWQKAADEAFQKCPRDWFDQEQTNLNRIFDDHILTIVDFENRRVDPGMVEENSRLVESAISGTKRLLDDHLIFSKLLLLAPAKVTMKMVNAQATADLGAIACALERHRLATGAYPETLEALSPRFMKQIPRDMIGGEPLRYRRTPDGLFVLYSVGWNQTDDDGTPAFFTSGRGPEIKDGDWVWRYPAGAK